jgi:hypothetical protein
MQSIERRVSALETRASAADDSLKVVFQDANQREAEALARAGYLPDALRVVFVSPADERL